MKFYEYAEYDALGLAQLLKDKQLSAAELAGYARAAIAEKNPALTALISSVESQTFDANGVCRTFLRFTL